MAVAWVLGDEESTVTLSVLELVQKQGAMYLELALRHHLPLATLDRQLAVAARAAGAEVLGGAA